MFMYRIIEKILLNFRGIDNVRIPDDADQRSGMMPITIPF